MTDRTGLLAFIAARIAEDRAEAAMLPEHWRTLFESTFALLENQLAEHQPDPDLTLSGEPLCTGCVEDVPWPCDFALQAASIWSGHRDYRAEWGDALEPLSGHRN
jgi:hypothetical protein